MQHFFGVDGADDNVIDQDLRAQCAGLGIDPEKLLPPGQAKARPDDYEVLPEGWPSWQVFVASQTQWRIVAGGFGKPCYVGLDYPGVEVVMRRGAVPRHEQNEVFALVQIMEREALQILNRDGH